MMIQSVKYQIHVLANEHGVAYIRTALDDWADHVTRVCDDDIILDETEELLIALSRAGVISGIERSRLHVRYLDESKIAKRRETTS